VDGQLQGLDMHIATGADQICKKQSIQPPGPDTLQANGRGEDAVQPRAKLLGKEPISFTLWLQVQIAGSIEQPQVNHEVRVVSNFACDSVGDNPHF
jgi:hypothetical protein